eukprot:4825234-Pyramimonas_sp.AAC.3
MPRSDAPACGRGAGASAHRSDVAGGRAGRRGRVRHTPRCAGPRARHTVGASSLFSCPRDMQVYVASGKGRQAGTSMPTDGGLRIRRSGPPSGALGGGTRGVRWYNPSAASARNARNWPAGTVTATHKK